MTVEIYWGMWSHPASHADGSTEPVCQTVIRGIPALVSEYPPPGGLSVLYLTRLIHEPLVSAWSSSPADHDLVRQVALGGSLVGPLGPNRY